MRTVGQQQRDQQHENGHHDGRIKNTQGMVFLQQLDQYEQHGKEKQQQQQAILVVVQLAVARLVALAADLMQRLEQRQQFLNWLEPALKAVEGRAISQPGRVTIRRLNRAEYNNTVRDLVGVDFRPADEFPADDVGSEIEVFGEAEAFEFCSSVFSRKMMEADRHNIVFCPYVIAVYTLPSKAARVYLSYRRPQLVGSEASKQSLREVEGLLDEIIKESLQ